MKNLLSLTVAILIFSSCNWFKPKPEIATALSAHFKNDLYEKFDTADYKPVFIKLMKSKNMLGNPKTIASFYQNNDYLPLLTTRFFINGQTDTLINYLRRSRQDGFNPAIFNLENLSIALGKLKTNQFKSIDEVYPVVAELELATSSSLLKYVSFLHYGCVNPRNIYNRYYIRNLKADQAKLLSVLNTKNIVDELKKAQPTSKAYIELKKQLAIYRDSLNSENDPAIRSIKINMERLRWQLPLQSDDKVVVNIPDFALTWFSKNDTLAKINVCVGEKREATYVEKMKLFAKSGRLDDKPKNHETPQLMSVFNSIQVNPIWNIPVSIAKSEIYWMARKDPFYLENSNIKVYYKGHQILEPDTIDWNKYPREKLPFKFKQGSGEGNALGKFKFVFDNSSSIYLHDTNNKYAFKMANRAISHGCVRVEEPLKFAEILVGNKYQYDNLRMEVNLPPIDTNRNKVFKKKLAIKADTLNVFKLKPAWFGVRKNVIVHIAYYTAWAENGRVQFRNDVYNYDPLLWNAIKKFM